MKGHHILVLVLVAAAVIVGGCMAPEDTMDEQPITPTPTPTGAQAVGGSQLAPTPPVPSRGTPPQKVGFVDPATYHIATPTPTTTMTKPPASIQVSEKLVSYAVITRSGAYLPLLLTTEVYHIPFPYWAVNVSAVATSASDHSTNTHGRLVVEIRDPNDPNRIVEEIQYVRAASAEGDPIEETFMIREGYKDYYFTIRSESLKSFTITIRVPEKYLV